jgi:hypothetical protein
LAGAATRFMTIISFHASSAKMLNSFISFSISKLIDEICDHNIGTKTKHPKTVAMLKTTAAIAAT